MQKRKKPNEIYISRIYDAPVSLVWDAWTDPKKAAMWWGPRGFTLTTHSKDLRVGGNWKYTMHGPDGTDYPNITTYYEVEPLKKLVYDHGANDKQPALFRVTVTFEQVSGKTKMEMTMALADEESATKTKAFIKQAGGNGTWDRLGEYLSETCDAKDIFLINRSFCADIETVFKMWTEKKHFSHWMGPTGSTMEFLQFNLTSGGQAFYKMQSKEAGTMYGKIEYLEITPPSKLVYTQQFTDSDGNPSRHPLLPTFPSKMKTTVLFCSEGEQETRITLKWEVTGDFTKDEQAVFNSIKNGMAQGWTGSFDKLENLLTAK